MRVLAGIVSLGLVSAASAAVAQPPAADSNNKDSKRICRQVQPELGSRIAPRRVCRTRGEWEAEARQAQSDWHNRHRPATGDDR